jgi:hypothetical protein
MIPTDSVTDMQALKRRVDRFVGRELLVLPQFRHLLATLRSYGKAVIFGGLIRDLALGHSREFSSDIDIVVQHARPDVLERMLAPYGARKNAFDGYRFRIQRWIMDLWPYESTWAFRRGLVRGVELADLLKTTFFNWDQALYDLESRELVVSPHYLADLGSRRLSINLRETPNEIGCAVRTLRLIWQDNAILEPALAMFLHEQILQHGMHDLVTIDARRRGSRRLTPDFVGSVGIALGDHQRHIPGQPFAFHDFQQELPLTTARSDASLATGG